MPNNAPTLTAANLSVDANKSISGSALVASVRDADGDTVTQYRFVDNGSSGGYFLLDGRKMAAGQWFTVTQAQLAKLTYVGVGASGSETFQVQAYDGKTWSGAAVGTLSTVNHAATLATADLSINANKSVSAATLIKSVGDADGDRITQYRFMDNGASGGYFALSGAKIAAGQWVTVTAAQLGKLSYVAAGGTATETVSIQAFDGKEWSSSVDAKVGTINHAATVVAGSATIDANKAVAAKALLGSIGDADGDKIAAYRFMDNGSTGGFFVLGSQKIAAGQWVTVAAADLAKLSYVAAGGTASETFSIQVSDGKEWSATSVGTLTTVNHAAVATALSAKLNANQSIAASALIKSVKDADGDAITQYRFMDNGTGGGYLALSGQKVKAGEWVTVAVSDLAKLAYVAKGASGAEAISIQAHDGKEWSATVAGTVTTVNHAAVVAANGATLNSNQIVAASSLIASARDADGDAITQYRFMDNGAAGGYFVLSGQRIAAGQWVTVTAADLSKLSYVAAGATATDTVSIQAFDGSDWSVSATSKIQIVNHAATVTTNSATINANQVIAASSLIKAASDVDGDAITQYRFMDNGKGGGYFMLDGQKIANGQWVTIGAADLAKLTYVGGVASGAESYSVQAFDGKVWSTSVNGTLTTIEHAPVVAATTTTLDAGTRIAASTLIKSVSDADGDAIKQYRFMDNGSGGGHFELNGVTIGSGQWITINAADLAKLTYVAGATSGSETFALQASDGTLWSAISTGTITSQSVWTGVTDAGIAADLQTQVKNGAIGYDGLLKILKDAAVGGITAAEFASLQAVDTMVASSGGAISTSSYLDGIFHDLVGGNKANAWWNGGGSPVALGNMASGTTEVNANRLIGKWFLGTDLPSIDPSYGSTYKATSLTLWNAAGTPSYMDVNQGYVGDCYLMSSLAVIAMRDPGVIKSMIVDNGNNTWGVRFLDNSGAAHWVTVDNELPTFANVSWANGSKLEYANGSVGWVELVEKAYAQYNAEGYLPRAAANSYAAIAGGWGDPITEITGKAVSYYSPGSKAIVDAYNAGQEIMLATSGSVSGNLVGNHMYEVIGYDTSNGNVHLHNPWNTAVSNPAVIDLWVSSSTLAAQGCTFVVASGKATV